MQMSPTTPRFAGLTPRISSALAEAKVSNEQILEQLEEIAPHINNDIAAIRGSGNRIETSTILNQNIKMRTLEEALQRRLAAMTSTAAQKLVTALGKLKQYTPESGGALEQEIIQALLRLGSPTKK